MNGGARSGAWEHGSRGAWVAALVAVLVLMPTLLLAQIPDSVVAARTKSIASQLRCPVCQGLSLQDSQSELSMQMKSVISDRIRSGQTDQQVLDYFMAKYGEWILLEPPARGFNLAVYLVPLVVLLGGMGVLYVSVRKWTQPGPVPTRTS